MQLPEFIRLFEVRAPRIMWFLGAGASVAAGVPTAWDLIWQFKRKIYCSEQRVSPALVDDLTNPAVRARIQRHFDATGRFPSEGADEEYPAYFEASYPSDKDRRAFLEPHFAAKEPSFGHYVLAHLLKAGKIQSVWTTNFDRLVEEAAAKVFGNVTSLRVAALGYAEIADQAFNEGRWPLLVKLHGDFHSERLKNTTSELRAQDERMRKRLVEACRQYGLAVVGYSGRDNSVMEVLETAVDQGGFPNGLFWFIREADSCFERVANLIERAKRKGIEAALIEITTFDELCDDISRFVQGIDQSALARLSPETTRLVKSRVPHRSNNAPFLRMNALPVSSSPATCRLIECAIGGYADVQAAIEKAQVKAIATRCGAGVIAFGRDADLRAAFESYGITRFDFHPIHPERLARPTGELTLLYQALGIALANLPALSIRRKRSSLVLTADSEKVQAGTFTYSGVTPITALSGTVPNTRIGWREAATIQLDHQAGRIWLLVRSRVVLENVDEKAVDALAVAKEFVRERLARRRNQEQAAMLEGWIAVLFGDQAQLVLRAFNISDGADAIFEVERVTGFSGRAEHGEHVGDENLRSSRIWDGAGTVTALRSHQ